MLARHRHPRCKASEQEIAASLTGHYRDEHLFVLRQAIELYDLYQEKILRMAAMSLGRGDHALGAFYRRMGARVGKAKAITATARKLALLVYRMLRDQMHYQEPSAADYDQQQRSRILRGLRKRARALGFEIVDTTTGLVM